MSRCPLAGDPKGGEVKNSEPVPCNGYTRPECEPCPNTADTEVRVDVLGTIERKRLCAECARKILPARSRAWDE
jgi:hypothetical protein